MKRAILEAGREGARLYNDLKLEHDQAETLLHVLSELERVEHLRATANTRLREHVPMPEPRMQPPL